jgi:metallophosphoesterase superfamily enzyme
VRIKEKSGATYENKAWGIYRLNLKEAQSNYDKFNEKIKMISMPAFNDLIVGTTIDKNSKKRLNPLLSNNIFDYRSVEVYNLMGQRVALG